MNAIARAFFYMLDPSLFLNCTIFIVRKINNNNSQTKQNLVLFRQTIMPGLASELMPEQMYNNYLYMHINYLLVIVQTSCNYK